MERLILKRPDESYAEQIAEYKREFVESGSSMDGCSTLGKADSVYDFINNCRAFAKEETVPQGMVPSDTYMLVRADDNKLLGMVDIRHCLNDYLSKYGGHIGYSVRPSERGRGYAKKMLALALEKCTELKIGCVLVTCNENNIAGKRVILSCGGALEDKIYNSQTSVYIERYWIDVKILKA